MPSGPTVNGGESRSKGIEAQKNTAHLNICWGGDFFESGNRYDAARSHPRIEPSDQRRQMIIHNIRLLFTSVRCLLITYPSGQTNPPHTGVYPFRPQFVYFDMLIMATSCRTKPRWGIELVFNQTSRLYVDIIDRLSHCSSFVPSISQISSHGKPDP